MIDFGFHIQLRTLDQYSDANVILKWRNDYKIYQWCRQQDILRAYQHVKWMERQAVDENMRMYGIMFQEHLIGVCGLTDMNSLHRRAEFSLYIDPEWQEQGLGKNALKTLLSHGFSTFGLHSIFGETFAENPAIGMFEHLGFKKEGTRRDFYWKSGKFIDAHLYSMLFSEWENNRAFEGHRKQLCFT